MSTKNLGGSGKEIHFILRYTQTITLSLSTKTYRDSQFSGDDLVQRAAGCYRRIHLAKLCFVLHGVTSGTHNAIKSQFCFRNSIRTGWHPLLQLPQPANELDRLPH